MNNNHFGLFLVMLIIVTFFAPLFIERGYRKMVRNREEMRQEIWKKVARKAFVLYAIGATCYVVGLTAYLPWVLSGFSVSGFPNIIRLEEHGFRTYAVIYNHFVLDGKEFVLSYIVIVPLFLLTACFGLWRFEKSHEVMKMAERAINDKPEQ